MARISQPASLQDGDTYQALTINGNRTLCVYVGGEAKDLTNQLFLVKR